MSESPMTDAFRPIDVERVDPITAAPDLAGPGGRAWRLPLTAAGPSSALGGWLLEAPWAHPFWHSYLLTAIHLRPAGDAAPAVIVVPGATHERTLLALDPKVPRGGILRGGPVHWLQPANFVAQFARATDAEALAEADAAAQAVVDGRLSPDTDLRAQWVARFGGGGLRHG